MQKLFFIQLTERTPPSLILVDSVKKLHYSRNTDVRSLIPILTGLNKALGLLLQF